MKHTKSLLQLDWSRCFFPNCTNPPTQVHHVMHGPNRQRADEDGLVIHVCQACHDAIHFGTETAGRMDRSLKRLAQLKWEEQWKDTHTVGYFRSTQEVEEYVRIRNQKARQAWFERYGRNYLDEVST